MTANGLVNALFRKKGKKRNFKKKKKKHFRFSLTSGQSFISAGSGDAD